MDFQQTWREQIHERLTRFSASARAQFQQAAPNLLYGFLSGMTLWPVAEAVQRGDLAALGAFFGVAGGVGANLIANQVQNWKDEADAAEQLSQAAQSDPDVREVLDVLLDKLKVVEQAQVGMSDQDRAWFMGTLRREVAQLGSSLTVITVTGSGAVAMGERAAAAGAGGVAVVGDVYGGIYTGPPPAGTAEALAIYRRVLVQASRHLPLRGVDLGASDPTGGQKRFDLAQVYVDLDTKTWALLTEEKKKQPELYKPFLRAYETRILGLLEATVGNRRLVILGDPGSGKSTFLNHLALCLAAHGLESECQGWLARLPGWPETEANALPVPVVLRDFARWLPEDAKKAEPCHLWDFIVSRLKAQNLALAEEPLRQALEEGQAFVLLDGLDEIPTKAQRTFIQDAVATFAGRYPKSRLAITCRTLSYQDPAWQLEGFPDFELAPFDEEKINRFIEAWYGELARLGIVKTEEADGLARQLQKAVRRPDLWRLAPNPLLLTVMALVHTHKGRLPNARALLYEDTVDVLLWRWEQLKTGGEEEAPRLRRLLLDSGRTDVDLKRVLWRLAFEAHREDRAGDEALADVGELRLEKALARLHPEGSRDWAHRVIEAMKLRAGLLLERAPEVYTFPHRTFQEYLAGAHLSAQADFARQAAGLVEEGVFWREVVLLAVGRLVYLSGDVDKPLALVGELCPEQIADSEVAWRKTWLAGEALAEMGLNRVQDSALGRDLAGRVRHRLADLVGKGYLSPVERAAAGDALACLGDPRPGVGLREDGLPDVVWCEVPAGPFVMGSDEARDPQADEDELPQHEVTLPAYAISKYPVTNAQFQAFVEAGGYRERRYWVEAEAAQYWQDGMIKRTFHRRIEEGRIEKVEKKANTLEDFGEPFNLSNHPVVGITWYEAVAFCRWLTERLREIGEIGPDREVTLPTEAQWEKAARGEDGRVFPWGNEFDAAKCNVGDTGIGTTSAMGMFPAGASPYGAQDMSGNVWEWCRTKWQGSYRMPVDEFLEGSEVRVLRGGSWVSTQGSARCAARLWDLPLVWYLNFGFRLVSPVLF